MASQENGQLFADHCRHYEYLPQAGIYVPHEYVQCRVARVLVSVGGNHQLAIRDLGQASLEPHQQIHAFCCCQ